MEWENAQIAVLRRVASGETTWRPEGRAPQARADFDATIEHILALHHRGLLQCSTPIAELHGEAQYAEVADVVLTPEAAACSIARMPHRSHRQTRHPHEPRAWPPPTGV